MQEKYLIFDLFLTYSTPSPRNLLLTFFLGSNFHAQYDWTAGVPDNGNELRKFRAVPRLYRLRSLVLYNF